VSGALAERVFVDKLHNVGFADVEILDRRPFGLQDAGLYPLFTPDLIELMETLLPAEQRAEVATAIIVTARKPA
jgi:arsenite methyltransferase